VGSEMCIRDSSLTGFLVVGLPTLYVDLLFIAILGYTVVRLMTESAQSLFNEKNDSRLFSK